MSDEQGFTVLEVLLTIVLAAFFMLSMTTIVNNFNVLNARTRDLTVANAFIENKVEALRNAAFISLPADSTVVDITSEVPATLTDATAQYTVVDESVSLKRIDIVLAYEDYGQTRTLRYSTAIGELGVGQY